MCKVLSLGNTVSNLSSELWEHCHESSGKRSMICHCICGNAMKCVCIEFWENSTCTEFWQCRERIACVEFWERGEIAVHVILGFSE